MDSAVDQAPRDTRNVVLIVEDEPIVRMSITDALLQAGFEVLASSNGADALELIATRPVVSAVVTDIIMPGAIDGFELAREVQHRWPDIGIVLVSGQMEPPKSHCPGGSCSYRSRSRLPRCFGCYEILRSAEYLRRASAMLIASQGEGDCAKALDR
jgi:CheY-like chemotaxis protein